LTQGQTWSGDAKEFLETLTAEGASCKFLERVGGSAMYRVSLTAGSKDVAREMLALAVVRGERADTPDSTPKPPAYQFRQLASGETTNVFVSYVDSVENFFVQLSESADAIENLMAQLGTYYDAGKGKPIPQPQVKHFHIWPALSSLS
jgi:hypothetical protein